MDSSHVNEFSPPAKVRSCNVEDATENSCIHEQRASLDAHSVRADDFAWPCDWPKPGPIDLDVQDAPHASADTEWWYFNAHFETTTGRRFSVFAAFFRIRAADPTGQDGHAHSLTWALCDLDRASYHAVSRVDHQAPRMGLERIRAGRGSRDPRLNRAIEEILVRGRVPAPDRLFEGEVHVARDALALDYAGATLGKNADGSYRVRLTDDRTGLDCELKFAPLKPAIRHGDAGVVRGTLGEHMFYYFIPRCQLTGALTIKGERQLVATGDGWYDHEFGGHVPAADSDQVASSAPPPERPVQDLQDLAWNWTAIQLADGWDLSAYQIERPPPPGADKTAPGTPFGSWMVLSDPTGRAHSPGPFELQATRWWRSTRTFTSYPCAWRLHVPQEQLDLTIEAEFDDQEFVTVLSKPAFWEGRCRVRGTWRGRTVTGNAFIERSGYEQIHGLEDFFHAVGDEVRNCVARALPLQPDRDQLRTLIASPETDYYLDGVDRQRLADSLLAPIRTITDRGGKAWRSYAALACCDVVEGDSRKFVQWLAVPELLHVGSLIIDDVQDDSLWRRGGPSCHAQYGQPVAINSGTAAYFLCQAFLHSDELTDTQKLRIYDLYFRAMRAGHAGQALDLDGSQHLVADAVATGDSRAIESGIIACHRLKTGAPAGCLARMGAIAGGGSEAQISALGGFFDNLGVAFQVIDDVLNLRGFANELKTLAEDLSRGVVTLPVAKALSRVDANQRRELHELLKSRPTASEPIDRMLAIIDGCGALNACVTQAEAMVESAWQSVEPHLPDSLAKVMLRGFGWYVLERHY